MSRLQAIWERLKFPCEHCKKDTTHDAVSQEGSIFVTLICSECGNTLKGIR